MIDTAASQLTKTAIIVTAIFIVSLGFDSWYYLVGFNHYEFKSTIQIIGQYYTSFGSNWYYMLSHHLLKTTRMALTSYVSHSFQTSCMAIVHSVTVNVRDMLLMLGF